MLLLAIVSIVLYANVAAANTSTGNGLSYDDLKQLKVSCDPKDTCAGRSPSYLLGIRFPNLCSCHAECPSFCTCFIDSPHRGASSANQKCGTVDYPRLSIGSSGYYMVQSCPGDSAWKHLCERGLDKEGDVLGIAPVTSLDTNTTYRNYYCFRCNEQSDHFRYWDLNLLTHFNNGIPENKDGYNVTYNEVDNTWSATAVGGGTAIDVRLQFRIPAEKAFRVIECNPNVVTGCPDSWTDDNIRSKCDSYTAILYKSFGVDYINAYCALCNSEPVDILSRKDHPGFGIRVFSFSYLIDVNRSDGDEEGKKPKCTEGDLWDPYGKKCRKLSCALPGYYIKDGKCAAP